MKKLWEENDDGLSSYGSYYSMYRSSSISPEKFKRVFETWAPRFAGYRFDCILEIYFYQTAGCTGIFVLFIGWIT